MAGRQANRTRRAGHVVGLAVVVLALGAKARSQVPGQPGPATPGDAQAQSPSSPLPTGGMPAASFAEIVGSGDPPQSRPGTTTAPQPWYNLGPGETPTAARVELGLLGTITESIFGEPDRNSWRPLPISTLL